MLRDKNVSPLESKEIFDGKLVVLFGLPGAFTPTCSAHHLPGFVEDFQKHRDLKVDTIACVSVNDAYVMAAWEKDQKAEGKVLMLADGDASFSIKMGLDYSTGPFGGVRCQRFLALVQDGVIKHLAIDEDNKFEVSSSEAALTFLATL